MKVAVIGGGPAGFYAAIAAKENHPKAEVTVFEKSKKLLSKVKVSGGGRCNVKNACASAKQLSAAYPRGGKALAKAFRVFDNRHTIQWFEVRGVPLATENDDRVFPVSQDSQSIIDCLIGQTKHLGIKIEISRGIKSIQESNAGLHIDFFGENISCSVFDKVIVATGGAKKRSSFEWLQRLGHKIEDPVPSLFTFNMPTEAITELMGVVAENTLISIQGTKLKSEGPLLITHWGMSGPAILKLSSFGARLLNEMGYEFKVQVSWANERNSDVVLEALSGISSNNSNKHLSNVRPYDLPARLWVYLLNKIDLPEDKKWGGLGKKHLNRLVNVLSNDVYSVKGKSTFKEEFVTCGGVSLEDVDMNTMQSKVCRNLYFAGEVLDIDGITGGYNFQSAWTTGYIAGKLN